MNNFNEYFAYLKTRSNRGRSYRKYWLYPTLVRYLKGSTLDIGCGLGDMLTYRAQTIGADINPHAVDYCRAHGLDAHLMQPDRLPFQNKYFDSVLLDNVLEHLENPNQLLGEIGRVLREKGTLLIGLPGKQGWLRDPDHKVNYDEQSLNLCLSNAGFNCQKIFYMPLWRSSFLSKKMRMYCIYACFVLQSQSIIDSQNLIRK